MEVLRNSSYSLSVRVNEFMLPPVTDGLILGKDAPIGFQAITKALNLLIADNLESIELEDDTISHVLVRRSILRRIPKDKLVAFLMERVKPLMCRKDVLRLDIKAEVILEETHL